MLIVVPLSVLFVVVLTFCNSMFATNFASVCSFFLFSYIIFFSVLFVLSFRLFKAACVCIET
jgi:hypothetical protein